MTAILLNNFSYRISNNLINEVFSSLASFNFNANSNVNTTADFISCNNVLHDFKNGDSVIYYTDSSNTTLAGLSNNTLYYVTSANTSGIKLALANGFTINVTASIINENGHFIKIQKPNYYFVASKHTEWDDELNPPLPQDNEQALYDFNTEILFGKRVNENDLSYMIRKIDWAANTTYNYYDNQANNLYETDFYVLTASNNVYKCLYNNDGVPSTIEPSQTTANTFQTGDGYIWKYMYTLSGANNAKFSTNEFIPVDANTLTESAAVNGSIEIVKVENSGSGYIAYANGTITEVLSNTIFKLETGNTSTINGFYDTSSFYIYEGAGNSQLTTISNYVVNSSGHYAVVADPLNVDITSKYSITPYISIFGDGTGFKAIPVIDTSSNLYSISSVIVLNKGQNYSFANLDIQTAIGYGAGALLRPIMSPKGGHGSNAADELGSTTIAISVPFANNEADTISTRNKFRQLALVYDPKLYSNAQLSYTANTFNALTELGVVTGTISFSVNETITGLTTNAHARISYANSSYMEVTMVDGNFMVSETIVGEDTSATATISYINNPDIKKFTGEILFLDYFPPVTRSNTTTEVAKLLIGI